jgi:hypothetical protein
MTTPLTPADRVTIKVTVEDDQTISRFAVTAGSRVTFQNQGSAVLTLLFRNEKRVPESPFCKGKGKPEPNPVCIPQGGDQTLVVCDDMAGRWFKYTATIGKARPEDPIFIIE